MGAGVGISLLNSPCILFPLHLHFSPIGLFYLNLAVYFTYLFHSYYVVELSKSVILDTVSFLCTGLVHVLFEKVFDRRSCGWSSLVFREFRDGQFVE